MNYLTQDFTISKSVSGFYNVKTGPQPHYLVGLRESAVEAQHFKETVAETYANI
jgi:hypothetical protein